MQPRFLSLLAVTVITTVTTAAAAGAVQARLPAPAPTGAVSSAQPSPLGLARAAGTCFYSLTDPTAYSIPSQDFEAELDGYDAEAATDVQLDRTCKVKSLQVVGGYFRGDGPAESFDIRFYRNKGSFPQNKPFAERLNVSQVDGGSIFGFEISPPVTIVKGEHVWISVQANMDYGVDEDQWYWTTTDQQDGRPGAWRNKSGGFGLGCEQWARQQSCWPDANADLTLALSKRPLSS